MFLIYVYIILNIKCIYLFIYTTSIGAEMFLFESNTSIQKKFTFHKYLFLNLQLDVNRIIINLRSNIFCEIIRFFFADKIN